MHSDLPDLPGAPAGPVRGVAASGRLPAGAGLVPGFLWGLRHPALLVPLPAALADDGAGAAPLAAALEAVLQAAAATAADEPTPTAAPPTVVQALLQGVHRLQRAAGQPVFECGRLVAHAPRSDRVWVALTTPVPGLAGAGQALAWMLSLHAALVHGGDVAAVQGQLPALLRRLAQAAFSSSNVPRFLRAAFDAGLPCSVVAGAVLQFGQGARSCWLDSSYSDRTPLLAARLARDKQQAAVVLRRAGVPVPAHEAVSDVEAALRAAQRLGWPVVVKPLDCDGGVGVAAGLHTPQEVREAFAQARRHSRRVLVERHFHGRDYRLVVVQGRLLWAIERVPGGVSGDGRHTVRELLTQLNADPRRGSGPHAPLRQLTLDAEAQVLLARAGLSEDSVLPAGRFLALRRAANVASGGTPVAAFDRVHPDNRRLAERAADALGLDLAGVDLLIPDIARSWLDSGAAVCEVNGQPNLGYTTSAHLYGEILQRLLPRGGRIPVAVVLGGGADGALAQSAAAELRRSGLVAGWATAGGACVGGERVAAGPLDALEGSRLLAGDRGVQAALLCLDDATFLRTGLAFDRIDALVLAGDGLDAQRPGLLRQALAALAPACRGPLLVLPGAARTALGRLDAAVQASAQPVAAGEAAARLAQRLLRAEAALTPPAGPA
ncbi:ATP-binding protein [Azohydromonas aeria]|uniref:ATP-binding protein n=1 Tax=Azohydromonas aeria TaxID=2590212 RepID=UPI0012F784F3|nr:acetate--CoA ligase family protein [Azohydromonas aeria]